MTGRPVFRMDVPTIAFGAFIVFASVIFTVTAVPYLTFQPAQSMNGTARVALGDAFIELERGDVPNVERPLLNHLGALVASADEQRGDAAEKGIDVVKVVDAPNTLAVFVRGPDNVTLEYIEHKPSFSLV